jgi:hypothetical protein
LDDRDQQVLMERIGGATLRELGDRHDLSHEAIRLIVVRAAREHIDQIVLSAWVAQKEGTLLALAVPAWADQDLAAEYFAWIAHELKRRDDGFWRLHYRPTPDGSFVFAIEDLDFNPTGSDDV